MATAAANDISPPEEATIPTSAASQKKGSAKKKRSGKKKKRISKHVLKAKEEAQASSNTTEKVTSQSNKPQKLKDPTDVHAYLTNWKKCQSADATEETKANWKFNKNTQSWLIRHAYETDKVPKATFAILLEYLEGLKGGDTKKRLLSDATRRALRYKDYESKQQQQQEEEAKTESAPTEQMENDDKEEEKDSKKEDSNEDNPPTKDQEKEEQDEDHQRWSKLDDHDKRKEYKRARRILDCIKE